MSGASQRVLPLLELVVDQLGVVDDDALELAVELLPVDAMRSLYLAVQRCARPGLVLAAGSTGWMPC
jgi:hypothetical protein